MSQEKSSPWNKRRATGLHPANPFQGRYDMPALSAALPELQDFLTTNPRGELTIDFSDASAVVCLNRALLKQQYGVEHWSLPQGFLCPPIPGRADYLYYLNDLLQETGPRQAEVQVLDIGTGANLIYPIIGSRAFGWHFVASEADSVAVRNAHKIITGNPQTLTQVEIRMQRHAQQIFSGVIQAADYFDLTLCNPPFFASQKEAEAQARRKWRNLKGESSSVKRNFGGQSHELWCEGGELNFLKRMLRESVNFAGQVGWFTSLVSKEENIAPLKRLAQQLSARDVRVVAMSQGQKNSRFIAWRF